MEVIFNRYYKLCFGYARDLSIKIPARLLQVLHGCTFLPRPPDVLHSVTEIKVHMLGDLDTLDPGGMGCVVGWMIDRIIFSR
jgi:hypothetical protein